MADSRKRGSRGSAAPNKRRQEEKPRTRGSGAAGSVRGASATRAAGSAGHAGTVRAARSSRPTNTVREASAQHLEGRRAAAEALRTGFPIKRALVADEGSRRDAALTALVQDLREAGVTVEYVSRAALDTISSHGAHQGIVLEVGAFPYADLADIVARAGAGPALVVVLDHITDAGNFGAIVRSAEVVGAAGVVIANKRAAEVNVGSYKTSAGAVMHLPIARVPNIARALGELKAAGFWAVGASEHAEGTCWDASFEGRIALVMGSEGSGISRLVLETCDDLTKLPQRGRTESLNVAQATTALCYEWLRCNRQMLDGAAVGEA